MSKNPRKEPTMEYDPTKPLDISKQKISSEDCFGKECDMRDIACYQCGDRDICSIVTKNYNDSKSKEIATKANIHYLDEADFDAITEKDLDNYIVSGETTTAELILYVSETAKCSDRVAVIEYIKRYVKSNDHIYTKSGIVWKRH